MPMFPPAVPSLPPLVPYTQDQILALFDRILPDHYLAPLKNPGPGYEYLQAVAKMIARVSEAIAHVGSGCYIGSSDKGSYAEGQVELYRDNADFGPFTLLGRDLAPQGTLVGTADGYYYQLVDTVEFLDGELGPKPVQVRAVTRGWLWNVPGPMITSDGELVPGPINRLVKPVFPIPLNEAPNFDPTVQVRQRLWGTVTFTRPTADAGVAILAAGTLLSTTAGSEGPQYVTIDDAVFGASSVGPVTVRYIYANGVNIGGLDGNYTPLWGPDSAIDASIVITESSGFSAMQSPTGGSAPMLDGVGVDRGIPRNFSGITQVQLSLTAPGDAVTILPGTVLGTIDGFHYETTSSAVFGVDDTGQRTVNVMPLFLNVPANDKPISQVISVEWSGGGTEAPPLSIASSTPTLEEDAAYKARLTFLPDTVTPNALRKTIAATLGNLLSSLGLTWDYREVWDLRYQTAYDFPFTPDVKTTLDYAAPNVPVAPFNSAVFVYDYVPLQEALSNRYLADSPERGVVVIRLPPLDPAELQATVYPGLAANLEKIKPAGTAVLYVLGFQ